MSLTVEDFSCCRCCLIAANSVKLQPLFGNCVDDLLRNVIPMKVEKDDDYPQQICSSCIQKLSMFYRFKKVVLSSHQALTNALQISKNPLQTSMINTEPNDIIQNNMKSIIPETKESSSKKHENVENTTTLTQVILNQNSMNDSLLHTTENTSYNNSVTFKSSQDSALMEKTLKCTFCTEVFGNNIDLKVHTMQHKQMCEVCGKAISSLNMKRHSHTHASEKNFVCEYCQKPFADKSNFVRHIMVHTGENRNRKGKPYLCSYCGGKFKWHSSLNKHLRLHTQINLHICKYCSRPFIEKKVLETHLASHTGVKSYKCDKCQRCFGSARTLNRHGSTHAPALAHRCDICGKTYAQKRAMISHKRQHSGERPYKCEECPKTFKWNTSLRAHKDVHTKRKNREESQKHNISSTAINVVSISKDLSNTNVIEPDNTSNKNSSIYILCKETDHSSMQLENDEANEPCQLYLQCKLCPLLFTNIGEYSSHYEKHT